MKKDIAYRGLLRHMKQGEGRASEASWTPPTAASFTVEMG